MALEARPIPIRELIRDHQKKVILRTQGKETLEFITRFLDPDAPETTILKTDEPFNIELLRGDERRDIIDLYRLNDIRDPDRFLRSVNEKLPDGGLFIGCLETLEERKSRILKKYPPLLNRAYYFMDFVFRRVFPKLPFTRRFEFFITAARNRPMSKAEALGRAVHAGFKIVHYEELNGKLHFVVRKEGSPQAGKSPSRGILIGIPRIGKDKRVQTIYKFRTMHPYAQYLQDHVYQMNDLEEGGKFRNDFRVTSWGRFMRKLWIDEWPMVYHLIRGELKLVGVRPLSQHYFELYRPELQELRTRFKPGLIPPFYADMPKTLEEIMDSEERYLKAYRKAPIRTDLRYFFAALRNILFKKARTR